MSTSEKYDPLDRRLNAIRPDVADIRLKGKVRAKRFVAGEPAQISVSVADLRSRPDPGAGVEHQLLYGAQVRVFDRADGWVWLQDEWSRYVGWSEAENLCVSGKPTHIVRVPRTFVYPGTDLKLPRIDTLSMGALVTPVGEETTRGVRYAVLEGGSAVIAGHIRSAGEFDTDYVAVARQFIHTPYLWGGSSGFGLDCSGLVELAMRMCGSRVLRDSDLQAVTVGEPVDPGPHWERLARGDLILWRGHVAIVEGDGNLLHANGYSMDVASEPLAVALSRIETMFEKPTGCRRPDRGPA